MRRFEFQLSISTQQYLNYYRGTVNQVLVRCSTGETIQFPASHLTPYVSTAGIQGRFVLTCDDTGKGAELLRLA